MNEEFIGALEEIEREKGISKEIIFDALESALISSYKKNFGTSQNVTVDIDRETGKIELFAVKEIVADEDVEDDSVQMTITDAKKLDPKFEVGDIYSKEIEPAKFGRIAAQTAKQVVIQRIKDAERDVIYEDFTDRENEIITGQVQRVSYGNVFFDLGRTEAVLPQNEQIKGENYKQGDRFKLLLLEVKKTTKGPQVVLSRSHPNLIKRLFELEVPEISDGIVEIYSIAREAGSRTKIAVFSRDEKVDPLGACVGYKGARVKAIVDELHDEKIDIVIYEKDIEKFIANALSPSKVEKVFANEKEKSALVVVPDYQLSLAIGKEGQNARLAAKLTNWKIDIKSVAQFEEYLETENLTEEDVIKLFSVVEVEENEDLTEEIIEPENNLEDLTEEESIEEIIESDEDSEDIEEELENNEDFEI
ncbi:transcription termination factor NusA [Peptoniphilus stercorisuis]|uniref:Transcription termination/antitermination protein NusA n=1 Tax=Peptoniphilus stercorisuis TaxID=1436965 RepID=A0ABS4KDY2_9FIRM|nr:transcription termination factor NusA [Peptoniphilus stercorisuis]MBP2025491.1 N utilization substance protein A [Peptoniphilus stercorisuis]